MGWDPSPLNWRGSFYFKIKVLLNLLMGRTLAIDYGKKRVGLAVTDPLKISTRILPFKEETKVREWLLDYFETESVDTVVIGYPEHKDESYTELTTGINALLEYIQKIEPSIEIVKAEESFTTKEAMTLMIRSGVGKKKRREKGLIDSYSALVILEEFLRK